ACLVLLLTLVAVRRGRAEAKPAVKEGNALDQGLRYLIKDVTRSPADHEQPLTPLTAPRRTPRGTPSDSVLLSARLPAAVPKDDGVVRLASTPGASSSMPAFAPHGGSERSGSIPLAPHAGSERSGSMPAVAHEPVVRVRVPSGSVPASRAPSSDDFD